ncbi:hypothetical protein H072_4157 [Dactylellina haptotyla CBS 200.50]|uniref:BAG domain-containing protein n=1 Tax=Dactylellina haptotyla (strain CBS 200.50) TaxID=1284197 RepID=S8AFR7_DACHA|nr:hypothetical protein H072_4157 [Dactylellina haptotyla CBS 200.50]
MGLFSRSRSPSPAPPTHGPVLRAYDVTVHNASTRDMVVTPAGEPNKLLYNIQLRAHQDPTVLVYDANGSPDIRADAVPIATVAANIQYYAMGVTIGNPERNDSLISKLEWKATWKDTYYGTNVPLLDSGKEMELKWKATSNVDGHKSSLGMHYKLVDSENQLVARYVHNGTYVDSAGTLEIFQDVPMQYYDLFALITMLGNMELGFLIRRINTSNAATANMSAFLAVLASQDLWEAVLPTRLASLLSDHLTPISNHFSAELSYLQARLPPSLASADPNVLVLLIIFLLTFIPLSIFTFPMRRFLKSVTGSSLFDDDDETRTVDTILVQHAKDTLQITFPRGDVTSGTSTVADLRAKVQDALGLSRTHSIKLVFAGHNLKDDTDPLSKYNLKHGAKVLCMASKSKLAPPPASSGPSSARSTPEPKKKKIIPPMEMIDLVRKHVQGSIVPLVEAFESNPPPDAGKRKEEHNRLGETLLGEMLKLDSVDVDGPDGAEVRKKRKETVRELHGLLERLDKVDKPQ